MRGVCGCGWVDVRKGTDGVGLQPSIVCAAGETQFHESGAARGVAWGAEDWGRPGRARAWPGEGRGNAAISLLHGRTAAGRTPGLPLHTLPRQRLAGGQHYSGRITLLPTAWVEIANTCHM